MIIPHYFGIGLEEYASKGKKNDFPRYERCPGCNCIAEGNLHRNGYYFRYGIDRKGDKRIPICRIKCLACKVNISILPEFLIPYFQHTLYTVVDNLHCIINGEKMDGCRQQLAQHFKRFKEKLPWIHSFFVDEGHQLGHSQDTKKEAQKYVKMILDLGESTFFRRSWGHLSSYFMGKLILPYLSPEKNNIHPT